jgi:hypothetical protein
MLGVDESLGAAPFGPPQYQLLSGAAVMLVLSAYQSTYQFPRSLNHVKSVCWISTDTPVPFTTEAW